MTREEEMLRARLVLVREAAERARALNPPQAGAKGEAQVQLRRGGDVFQPNKANKKDVTP